MNKVIENILKVFSESKEASLKLSELQSKVNNGVTSEELLITLQSLRRLFRLATVNNEIVVKVEILLKACPDYNNPLRGCSKSDCQFLHTCEKKLNKAYSCKNHCSLNHLFAVKEIKTLLTADKFDYNQLMKFYQTFYSANEADFSYKSENKNKNKNAESDNESEMTTDCEPSNRRVFVRIPEKFIKECSQKQFFDMFAKKDITGGGFIESLVYTPESRSAIITYKSGKTAKRVIFRKELTIDGNKFIVKRYYADQKRQNKNKEPDSNGDFFKIESVSDHVPVNGVFIKHKIYLVLENCNSLSDEAKIERISTILAKTKPQHVYLVDPSIGKWIVEFTPDKIIEIGELWKTYEVANKFLPSNIKIEPVRNESNINTVEKSIPTCSCSNESNVNQNSLVTETNNNNNNRRRNRVRRRKGEQKSENDKTGEKKIGSSRETYMLQKRLVKNEYLSIVLKGRDSWLDELKAEFRKVNANFVYDKDALTITPMDKVSETASQKDWYTRMNRVISDYFYHFRMEKIAYDLSNQSEIENLKLRIRSSQLIQYYDDPRSHRLFIMGKINNFDGFFNNNEQFKDLLKSQPPLKSKKLSESETSSTISRTAKSSRNDKVARNEMLKKEQPLKELNKKPDLESTQIISRHEKLPKYLYPYEYLIAKLLDYLKQKFDLSTYFIDSNNNNVDLIGYSSNANQAAVIYNASLNRIKTKNMINDFNMKILKAKQLESILNHCLNTLDLIFQIKVRTFESKEEPGIFLSYFQNMPEIDSSNESVYDRVKNHIANTIEYEEISIKKQQAHLFLTPMWIQLNNEHFNAEMSRNNFEIVFNPATSTLDPFVSLIGKKTFLWQVKTKIEQFLAENESKSSIINLDHEHVLYLQNLMISELKSLENMYDINVLFDNANLILENCPEKIVKEVSGKISKLFANKISNTYEIGPVPGIEKIKAQNLLYTDIIEIQKSTQTLLELKVNKIAPTINTSNQGKSDEEIQTQITNNHTLMTLRVNDSIMNLQSGNITNSKVDSILNLISEKPETEQGILSRAIYKAAGIGVLNRILKVKYESNTKDEVIITSAGNLDKAQYILHYNLGKYSKLDQGILAIRTVVEKCLKKVEELKLKSISFPTIGLGKQHFPLEIVSKQLLHSIFEYLGQNKSLSLTVNVVIFEEDKLYNQSFLNEMKAIKEKFGDCKEDIQNAPNNSLSLKVTSCAKAKLDVGHQRFLALLNEKYIKRETIDKDLISKVDTSEIKELLKSLSVQLKDCQITYRNRSIELYGCIQSVLEAKANIFEHINKLSNANLSRIQENLRISKDIQWQYEICSDTWRNFPVYLNSLIESKYAEHQPSANFTNEDNDNSYTFFNVNPMIYMFGAKKVNLRRVDVTKISTNEKFSFPSNWSPMTGNTDYMSVDISSSEPEYLQVFNDFCAKLGTRPTNFKLKRVQNPYLYKQYSTHKEKFLKENRQSNEMRLFHGSQEDSLKKICRFGFNRSYCGKNGVAYGQGVYFAVNSQYSNRFAGTSSDGLRCMLRAMVLVGDSCPGDSSMRTPPERIPGTGVTYDSTTDGARTIFVCYHDNQCYPEYLIYYN